MAAKIAGCPRILAVDVHDNRLELARELGATHAFNGKKVDVVKEIKAVTRGGTHYAVETTGAPPVVRQCLNALRPLGTAAIVGVTPKMELDVHNDLMAEGKSMIVNWTENGFVPIEPGKAKSATRLHHAAPLPGAFAPLMGDRLPKAG